MSAYATSRPACAANPSMSRLMAVTAAIVAVVALSAGTANAAEPFSTSHPFADVSGSVDFRSHGTFVADFDAKDNEHDGVGGALQFWVKLRGHKALSYTRLSFWKDGSSTKMTNQRFHRAGDIMWVIPVPWYGDKGALRGCLVQPAKKIDNPFTS